ncbi:MAG: TauD/TfdA family dioxygenase [Rhodospirillales bacterium]|nr:TauD/TfdA family dioxygenase [Rhodospirillales bacterium]QQS11822.1 MAG: TauD/TfdA family dioxygenase [Rhodospirillales bacterium]
MALTLTPIMPGFAAEAAGIDITKAPTPAEIAAIDDAMNGHAVLVWRGQPLTEEAQLAFARSFGELDIGLKRVFKRPERFISEELIDISNVDHTGRITARDDRKNLSNFANQLWHSDSSFMRPKACYSMLAAVHLPSWGGETEFADLRAAHDTLPAREKREIEGLVAEHSPLHSRIMLGDDSYTEEQKRMMPPVRWPLVQTHPGSGRKVLFVGAHITRILGWSVAESRLFVSDLLEHATRRENVYRHEWRPGDMVMWDNRATVHRGRRFDLAERRELRRTTTNDMVSMAWPQAAE